MAKRFGRNQKRKMQDRIDVLNSIGARLNISLDKSEEQRRELRYQLNVYELTIKETAAVLGTNFITLPPETYEVNVLRDHFGQYFEMMKQRPLEPMAAVNAHSLQESSRFINTSLSLPIMDSGVFVDSLRDKVHVRLKFNGGHLAYAVSRDAFRGVPQDYMVKRISEELARSLVKRFREEGIV